MRNLNKRSVRTGAPIYCYETDMDFERVIRDPMAVLLGRSTLCVQRDAQQTDPYNRVGKWVRGAR